MALSDIFFETAGVSGGNLKCVTLGAIETKTHLHRAMIISLFSCGTYMIFCQESPLVTMRVCNQSDFHYCSRSCGVV